MTTDSIRITGIKETQKALYSYSQQLGDRVVISALRQGANLTKRAVSQGAPVYQGTPRKGVVKGALRRGFRVYKSKIHNGKMSNSMIGVYLTIKKMKKGGRGTDDPFFARFIEKGWNTRGPARNKNTGRSAIVAAFGSRTGRKSLPGKTKVPGLYFIKNAFGSTKENAAKVIQQAVIAGAEIVKRKVGLK